MLVGWGGRRFVGGGGGEGAWDSRGWGFATAAGGGDEDEVSSEEMLAEHGERLGGGF